MKHINKKHAQLAVLFASTIGLTNISCADPTDLNSHFKYPKSVSQGGYLPEAGDTRPGHMTPEEARKLQETATQEHKDKLIETEARDKLNFEKMNAGIEKSRNDAIVERGDRELKSLLNGNKMNEEALRHCLELRYVGKPDVPPPCNTLRNYISEIEQDIADHPAKVEAEIKQQQDFVDSQKKMGENARAIGKAQNDAEKKANDEVACAWAGLHCSK